MSHFVIPNHTVVGTNVLGEAAPLLKKMGNKAFIVTGRHVCRFRYDETAYRLA